jgi:uncharacterized membrane protein
MKKRERRTGLGTVAAMVVVAGAAGPADAQWATLEVIPEAGGTNPAVDTLIHAVTPDGSCVVGFTTAPPGSQQQAFIWRRGMGTTGLGSFQTTNMYSTAYAVSDDGLVVAGVGVDRSVSVSRAFRWTAAEGMVQLPLIPGLGQNASSYGYGMTPDGQMIVGECGVLPFGPRTEFRWTAATGSLGTAQYEGYGISADRAYMSGTGGNQQAWRWHVGDPAVQFMPMPSGSTTSDGGPISRDGTTMLGDVEFGVGSPFYGFRWRPGTTPLVFNQTLPGYPTSSTQANALSADGSVVVGILLNNAGLRSRAFIWDGQHGVRDLNAVLTQDYGLNLGNWILNRADAISADGRWIAGNAYHADLSDESNFAYLVHFNDGCYANCDQSTGTPVLNVGDFTCFMNRYAAGDPYANCDDSTAAPALNVNDFVCYQIKFAGGCP